MLYYYCMSTDPKTIDSYNQHAQAYTDHTHRDKDSPFHGFYEKPAIREQIPDLTNKTVISIGCGSGIDTEWLRNKGASKAVGIDISEKLIDIAKSKYPKCDFKVMDMEHLEFEDNSFDFAYSSLAIHYVSDWNKALSEAYRVLKPDSLYTFSCGHPIDSALEKIQLSDTVNERKLGRRADEVSGERIIYGDYLAAEHQGIRPFSGDLLKGMTVHLFHRPISKMIESIHGAGFSIEKMIEPLPLPEMQDIDPNNYAFLSKIPAFIIWVLKK